MREYGKIIEYDGYCGTILSVSDIHFLALKKEFMYDEINEGDIVTFIAEKVKTPTDTKEIARFIDRVKEQK